MLACDKLLRMLADHVHDHQNARFLRDAITRNRLGILFGTHVGGLKSKNIDSSRRAEKKLSLSTARASRTREK